MNRKHYYNLRHAYRSADQYEWRGMVDGDFPFAVTGRPSRGGTTPVLSAWNHRTSLVNAAQRKAYAVRTMKANLRAP